MQYTHNEILFGHAKEERSDTCYNMKETWKQNAKERKNVRHKRPYMVWLSLYEILKMQPIETESRLVVPLDWEWRKARGKDGVWLIMGFFKNRVYFWSDKSFISHILVMVATTPWNTKPLNFSVIMAEIWVCCCSVTESCPTLCHLADCSTPGFPVPHYLSEFAQIHVHCVGDAI